MTFQGTGTKREQGESHPTDDSESGPTLSGPAAYLLTNLRRRDTEAGSQIQRLSELQRLEVSSRMLCFLNWPLSVSSGGCKISVGKFPFFVLTIIFLKRHILDHPDGYIKIKY